MSEPHVIAALIKKRAELAGKLEQAEAHTKAIRADLSCIDCALTMFGYSAKPETIPPSYKRPPRMFKDGQLRRMICDIERERPDLGNDRVIGSEVVRRMGWDVDNDALVKAVAASVHKIRWRLKRGEPRRGSNSLSKSATPDA